MGFWSRLLFGSKNKAQELDNNNDSYSKEINRCMSVLKISELEYLFLSRGYYNGHTSYKTLVYYATIDRDKVVKLIREVGKKSKAGCVLDFTFVRFYYSPQSYIDLPFEVFSDEKNIILFLLYSTISVAISTSRIRDSAADVFSLVVLRLLIVCSSLF